MTSGHASPGPPSPLADRPWVPYVAPFAVFLALTMVQDSLPGGQTIWYPVKTVLTGVLLLQFRRSYTFGATGGWWWGLLVGVAVFVLWIGLEGRYPLLGEDSAVDPFAAVPSAWIGPWIAIRLLGAVVVVAFMEELFWRGFLLRWLIRPDFERVAMGTFSWTSFGVTCALFAVEHNRWLAGLLAGAGYNLLLYRTGSLRACILAHALTNLALGVYVLVTGDWAFW